LIAVGALILGWVVLHGDTPLFAQQFRTQQFRAPQQAPPVIVNQQGGANPNAGAFNVIGGNNQPNGMQNGGLPNNANAIINGLNNGTLNNSPFGGSFANPYTAGLGGGMSPFAANPALDPTNYNIMMYGNPYGVPPGTPLNPFYNPYFNPYPFLNGPMMGMGGGQARPYPSPAQLYNFNYNFAYLSNPYLNPLSNPAFSGPFPAGAFSSSAALNLLGVGSILQNFPLPANGVAPGTGNNNNNPFP
jgi:hypothetical protein